jgi:hypothetical protein
MASKLCVNPSVTGCGGRDGNAILGGPPEQTRFGEGFSALPAGGTAFRFQPIAEGLAREHRRPHDRRSGGWARG